MTSDQAGWQGGRAYAWDANHHPYFNFVSTGILYGGIGFIACTPRRVLDGSASPEPDDPHRSTTVAVTIHWMIVRVCADCVSK